MHLQHGVQRRRRPERRPAGEHLVQDRSEGVDVGGGTDVLLGLGLFGGHVAGRAHDGAGLRQAAAALDVLGQAEIGDLRRAGGQRRLRGTAAGVPFFGVSLSARSGRRQVRRMLLGLRSR